MKKEKFRIIHEKGDVLISRVIYSDNKKAMLGKQRIKVLCIDSDQIDRIIQMQENMGNKKTRSLSILFKIKREERL